jgi:hypothetical protein
MTPTMLWYSRFYFFKRVSVSLFHLYIFDEIFDWALDDIFFFNESTVARRGLLRDASC